MRTVERERDDRPIIHDEGRTIITIPRVLTPVGCQALIDAAERSGFDVAPITTGTGFVIAPEVRNNTRVIVDDVTLADAIWQRAKKYIPARRGEWEAIGLNERLRFYRYEAGQYFAWHFDGAYERNDRERSHLTFMVYLNDDFEGGATEFDLRGRDLAVCPRPGDALVFQHAVRHQGATVSSGRKYVIRSDVMYRRG
jgi:predicted 2-oxoglutarate/Fe(II)-dependent dioxygenase YbiX